MTPLPHPIVLASGGTGGHVFPAKALADLLAARGHRVALVTDTRGSAFDGAAKSEGGGIEVHKIRAGGIAGRGIVAKLKSAVKLLLGWRDARRLLSTLNPSVVVGFGGYASVPTVLAAGGRGIPVVLHEQNAVIGRANRMLARQATAIATCFEVVDKIPSTDRRKVSLVGNPVREAVQTVRASGPAPMSENGPREILVTGGSQGASAFADLVPAAVALLPESLRARLRIAQQARPNEVDGVVAAYRDMGVDADVRRFFDDMPDRLRAAHLLICRSGASTVAENTVAGRPALMIPYPSAIDDHQTANARSVEAAGGAVVLPQHTLTPQDLADLLVDLLDDTDRLAAMTEAARTFGRPHAVEDLAKLVLATAGLTDAETSGVPAGAATIQAPATRSAAA
ncbi:MAG: undecaprenyldiphospho-muramoylpentapeptide beta-N-acetylglucosaminyltransferase [Alphaproteobacteria bacterium]|nr:undecaprenyldiphospho-muramoylpentapeptide beta-N-acetylglucosaminyltransferase [Alphaproteobacteria bacterium]